MIYVRFTPESGPFSALAFMSAYDPKRTFKELGILLTILSRPIVQAYATFQPEKQGKNLRQTLSREFDHFMGGLMAILKIAKMGNEILKQVAEPVVDIAAENIPHSPKT